MGRDRFEAMCKAYGFSVKRCKSKRKTTDSSGVVRFDNLVKDLKLTNKDEVWSSDITYFEVGQSFYYLTFIMDCHSRKILGYSVSSRLTTEQTTLSAMQMAIATRAGKIAPGLIFHSDGGGQYYDQKFLSLTKEYKMRNSMCKQAYENGKAERLNGIIKNNYLRHWKINNLAQLVKSVDRAVKLYNSDKPHKSLGRMTPNDFENKLSNLDHHMQPNQWKKVAMLSN